MIWFCTESFSSVLYKSASAQVDTAGLPLTKGTTKSKCDNFQHFWRKQNNVRLTLCFNVENMVVGPSIFVCNLENMVVGQPVYLRLFHIVSLWSGESKRNVKLRRNNNKELKKRKNLFSFPYIYRNIPVHCIVGKKRDPRIQDPRSFLAKIRKY